MIRPHNRPPLPILLCVLVTAVGTTGLSACGDAEGEGEEEQALTFILSKQDEETRITGPQSAEAGLAQITLRNDSKVPAELQLVRVEGDRSAEEAIQALDKAREGQAFPNWFFVGGGVGTTGAGRIQTVTQVLQPGTYYAVDLEDGPATPKSTATIEVSGERSDETVASAATVTAVEYGFESLQVPSGDVEIAFENAGDQPHHLIVSELTDGGTAAEVERALKGNGEDPPLLDEGTQSTAVIEGGESQVVRFSLKPARYVLYCFVSDRNGSRPHVDMGMVDEIEVR